jgi:hypothetical protein
MEDIGKHTKFEMKNVKRRDQMGDLSVDGKIVLKYI